MVSFVDHSDGQAGDGHGGSSREESGEPLRPKEVADDSESGHHGPSEERLDGDDGGVVPHTLPQRESAERAETAAASVSSGRGSSASRQGISAPSSSR